MVFSSFALATVSEFDDKESRRLKLTCGGGAGGGAGVGGEGGEGSDEVWLSVE